MNSTEIRTILRSPYNRESWKTLYRNVFQNKVTFHEEPYQYNVNEDIVDSLFQIGYATLDDEYIVALFEVNIKSDINLLSKKIGLRNIISKYISDDKFNGVLTIFENGSPDYRFTFASKTTKITEEGIEVVETESKRFTYILGSNEPCLTPTQRFENLFHKNGKINLDDIKDAFSVEKLNKEFFNGYKEHYVSLCNYYYSSSLKTKIFNDDDKLVRDFVKKFLGRIVFLYFVQKKGWLGVKKGDDWGSGDHLFLSNLFKSYEHKSEFYNKVVSKIFFEYLSVEREDDLVNLFDDKTYRIPYLNGGLFEKEDVDNFEINFEQSYLESLFEFFDRFNFTIYEDDPNEHTVAVDPEMLGHIFENLLEDNKDKGAFYTPKEIVHYMCQESLIEYLSKWFENKGYLIVEDSVFYKSDQSVLFPENDGRKGQLILEKNINSESKKIDRSLIESLLKKKLTDCDRSLIVEHSKEFHEALDKVKICDPAIGSGAFPMGLLQEIFISKQTLWNFEFGNLDKFPASEIKLNIIQNSIYGVDIEKGAVDISRLRFWLSLIVDEDEPKSLPNLDYKIVVGNSLISLFENEIINIDWNIEFKNVDTVSKIILNQQNKIYQLEHTQHLYFQSYTNKCSLKNLIKSLKIEILQNQLLLTKVSFSENNPILGGFIPTDKEEDLNNKNKDISDKFMYLISKLDEIKSNDKLNLNYFDWRLNFPEVLNSKINNNPGFDILIGNPPYITYKGKEVVNISDLEVQYLINSFPNSAEYKINSYALFTEKGVNLLNKNGTLFYIIPGTILQNEYLKKIRKYLITKFHLSQIVTFTNKIFEAVTDSIILKVNNFHSNSLKTQLIKKSNLDFSVLNDVHDYNQQQWNEESNSYVINLKTNKNDDIILSKIEMKAQFLDEFLEVYVGIVASGIKKFISNTKINNNYKKYLQGKHIGKYLIKFDNVFINFLINELHSNTDETVYLQNEKILVRKTGNKLMAAIDNHQFYTDQSLYNLYPKKNTNVNLKIITAILNSPVLDYYFNKKMITNADIFPYIKGIHLKKLPFKFPINESEEFRIEELVQEIQDKKIKSINTDILETQINILIYKIYELEYEEILVIEPNTIITKDEYNNWK